MRSFTAGTNDDGVRLSRFCEKVCPNIPKNLLHKSFRNKRIKVNGKKESPEYKLNQGDFIELYINDEFFEISKAKRFILVEFSKLNILYEDENVIFIFKPMGLLCHSDDKHESNLVDMLQSYLFEKSEFCPDKENTFTPALCNRIDQGTEGIVIGAKNYKALAEFNSIIRDNLVLKQYICVIQNKISDGKYNAFLARDLTSKKVTVTPHPAISSKEITTIFKTLAIKGGISLIECTLVTGRTHQIRAHLAFLGCPVVGDRKYGKSINNLESQLLSAYKITFLSLPQDSILNYLSNKEFKCKSCFALDYFNKL